MFSEVKTSDKSFCQIYNEIQSDSSINGVLMESFTHFS